MECEVDWKGEYIMIQTFLWVDGLVWILQLVFPQFKHNLNY